MRGTGRSHTGWAVDNLALKGIREDDDPPIRHAPKSGKKPYKIECRYVYYFTDFPENPHLLSQWFLYRRYRTEAQRDQAFEVLVNRAVREDRLWGAQLFRRA